MQKQASQSWQNCSKPLIIASSGGGGHISAAQSLISQLQKDSNHILTYHDYQKPSCAWVSFESGIQFGCHLYHMAGLKFLMQKLTGVRLPTSFQFADEMQKLTQQNAQKKPYIDFMLDIVPNGYAFTALFNYLQKTADAESLNQLVKQQSFIDHLYKKQIIKTIYKLLMSALEHHQPYDSLLSTQPIGMAAICEAVAKYNKNRPKEVPEIFIHQFITDIPHQSAEHYLKPIKQLDFIHKKNLILHVLDLNKDNIFLEKKHANKIFRYQPEENPMVREAFTHHTPAIEFATKIIRINQHVIEIKPKQKLALVMLSSANGQIAIDYCNALIHLNIEHIIVIGQLSPQIQQNIHELAKANTQIYLPGFLNAPQLSEILKYTNLIITKGGGLSLMELAGFHLAKNTIIAIHHPLEQPGLVWEDGNIEWFIKYSLHHELIVFTSQPQHLEQQVQKQNLLGSKSCDPKPHYAQ